MRGAKRESAPRELPGGLAPQVAASVLVVVRRRRKAKLEAGAAEQLRGAILQRATMCQRQCAGD